MAKNDVQNRCLVFEQISAPFWTIFGAKMDAKMDPKIALKSTSAPQGRPEASGEPFGSHFGAILDQCWAHFGLFLELSGVQAFHKTVENTVRNHSSKGLSKPLQARGAEGHGSVAGLGAPAPLEIRPPSL